MIIKNKFYLVEYKKNGYTEERNLFKTKKEAHSFAKEYGLRYLSPNSYSQWIGGSPYYVEIITLTLK